MTHSLRSLIVGLSIVAGTQSAWSQQANQPAKPAAPAQPAAPAHKDSPSADGAQPKAEKIVAATTPASRPDEWWQKRHESFNARVKQGHEKGDIDVLFIGDSITQGWENEGKQVWADRFAKFNPVNLGIGGDQTQHVLWRLDHGNLDGLDKPAAGKAAKLAVIMIGTNNVGGSKAEETAAGVEGIVSKVKSKVPGIKVLLLAIFPREEKPGEGRAKNTKVNEIIAKLGDNKQVFFLDIGAALMNKDGTLDKAIMPDFLHLSPEGYKRWADAIEPKLNELTK